MSTQTVTDAVAKRDDSPVALIARYQDDFGTVLPSHIPPATFVRLAQGALRRNATLERAARSNPGSFLAALLDAARLGLEPGTEQYHLVPYGNEVQGIVGYQGVVELIYRAGAVSSVIVEAVREKDAFTYRPGDGRPQHGVDWFGERGKLVGVYAYAVMTDGATSKVVVLGRSDIEAARASSASYKRKPETSPWTTHEEAMWLKTAALRLRKWVPTSAEYRREILRANALAQHVAEQRDLPQAEREDLGTVDGQVIEDWPEAAKPADAS